ncbi:MAG: LON peptidase substrate-binding domain-containing protein [Polyangiales bacterium]
MGEEIPEVVPVFPLPGLVLLPGQRLPLHIFEPRYRAMVRDVLDASGWMAVACIEDPDAEDPPAFSSLATVGRVVAQQRLPDGRFNILVEGLRRARLGEVPASTPYRAARVTPLRALSDDAVPAAEVAALIDVSSRVTRVAVARDAAVELRVPDALTPVDRAMRLVDRFVADPADRLAVLRCERGVDVVRAALAALVSLLRDLDQGNVGRA